MNTPMRKIIINPSYQYKTANTLVNVMEVGI